MPSFISPSEDASFRSAMVDLHDTWAKDIIVYSTRTRTVITTNPNHNFLYSTGPNQTETVDEVVKTTGKARIHYKKDLPSADLVLNTSGKAEDQINTERKDWDVKLVVTEDIKTLIEKAERITFNDVVFKVKPDNRPHGVVSYQFYNFYLKALN
jgi:hypothetical protein